MLLSGIFKKSGFLFRIDDVFSLKNGEAVVTGEALSGRAGAGDMITYANPQKEPVFSCRIVSIEQGQDKANYASSGARGRYGAHFALWIEGHSAPEFQKGWYFLSEQK